MKTLACLAVLCFSFSAFAQQPISPAIAGMAKDYESVLEMPEYMQGIATVGHPPAELQAALKQLDESMSEFISSEIEGNERTAQGDQYLSYELSIASGAEWNYFSSQFLGTATAHDPNYELIGDCISLARQSIKSGIFIGWTAAGSCMAVPDGASWSDVRAIYRSWLDTQIADLKAQKARLEQSAAQ